MAGGDENRLGNWINNLRGIFHDKLTKKVNILYIRLSAFVLRGDVHALVGLNLLNSSLNWSFMLVEFSPHQV